MSHTPGPWRVEPCTNGGMILIRADGKHGAHPQTHLQIVPEADARLIAAAPDLLEACKALIRSIDGVESSITTSGIQQIRTAIAKAEGKP